MYIINNFFDRNCNAWLYYNLYNDEDNKRRLICDCWVTITINYVQ